MSNNKADGFFMLAVLLLALFAIALFALEDAECTENGGALVRSGFGMVCVEARP